MLRLFDERLKLALRLLEEAGERPLSFPELRAAGVENPAQVVYELELAGHQVERSAPGIRLARSGPPEDRPRAALRRRRRS